MKGRLPRIFKVTNPETHSNLGLWVTWPHQTGRLAPVVAGRFPGWPVQRNQASHANAAGSIDSGGHPRVSVVINVAAIPASTRARAMVEHNTGLRAPPPARMTASGGDPRCSR